MVSISTWIRQKNLGLVTMGHLTSGFAFGGSTGMTGLELSFALGAVW